jgi:hypothetical protein
MGAAETFDELLVRIKVAAKRANITAKTFLISSSFL